MTRARLSFQELVVDCADPRAQARFWGELLGVRWAMRDDAWGLVDADPLLLSFQQVPEPKQSPKNRLHLDVLATDADAEVARAVTLGARLAGGGEIGANGDGYVVLLDPEDNEFCFVVDNARGWRDGVEASFSAAASRTPSG